MARILVIDDDPLIRNLLQHMLERAGHEVTLAADGDIGISVYRKQPADLVLTDLIMPGKEGIETIRELVQEFPGVKIIAMSGGGRVNSAGYLGLAGKLGASRTLAKPVERKVLIDTVEELLAE
jgi:CheY-like chemotaxis protein